MTYLLFNLTLENLGRKANKRGTLDPIIEWGEGKHKEFFFKNCNTLLSTKSEDFS